MASNAEPLVKQTFSMLDWAEHEVALKKSSTDVYGNLCLNSAIKAYKALTEAGHSGASWEITADILFKLCKGIPLTPITENDFDGVELSFIKHDSGAKTYQCPRMSSLFKDEYQDGTIKYTDINRVYCVEASDPNCTYNFGLARDIVDEMFPITLPYKPSLNKYKVITDTFLTDPFEGDWDTVAILSISNTDNGIIPVNRYFKWVKANRIEISLEEFNERKAIAENKEEMEKRRQAYDKAIAEKYAVIHDSPEGVSLDGC